MSLFPAKQRRWESLFSTYYMKLSPFTDCMWRFALQASPEGIPRFVHLWKLQLYLFHVGRSDFAAVVWSTRRSSENRSDCLS